MRDRLNRTRQCGRRLTATVAAASAATQSASAADDAATRAYHTALTDHVPGFITGPGQTDYLFIAVIVLILVMILAIGNFYFQLHAVPERIAHRANKAQLEIVAVLALISLFTHNHLYWIIGLLLAMIRIPDFSTPLYSIARSIARLASRHPEAGVAPAAPPASNHAAPVAADPSPPANSPTATAPVSGAPIAPAPSATHPHIVQPVIKSGAQGEGI